MIAIACAHCDGLMSRHDEEASLCPHCGQRITTGADWKIVSHPSEPVQTHEGVQMGAELLWDDDE